MNVYLFGMLAGVAAVIAEILYVRWTGPWWTGLHYWLPIQLVIGYSIFRLVTNPGTSLLDAFIVFALCTAILRVGASLWLGQDIRTGTWVAFGLIILANLIKTFWRT